MFNRDTLFSSPITNLNHWTFNKQVVEVFLDMVQRSIPGYSNIIFIIGMLAKRFVQPGTQVYDLGCSLGAVTLSVCSNIHQKNCKIIAVDNSSSMIEGYRRLTKACKNFTSIELKLVKGDIRDIDIHNASMVVLNFTLQFLPIEDRQVILNKIYHGLNKEGILVLSEKFTFEDSKINELLINMHYDFKRTNGYSELEINQKFDILKNIMFINSIETSKTRLRKAGFTHSELLFQYFNFGSLISLKG